MDSGRFPSTTDKPHLPWFTPRLARIVLVLIALFVLQFIFFWVWGTFFSPSGHIVNCTSSVAGNCPPPTGH